MERVISGKHENPTTKKGGDMSEFIVIIEKLSKIRIYNSCGVFKGVMIRDQEEVYSLVKEARELIKKLKETEDGES